MSPSEQDVDAMAAFRRICGHFPTGVTAVTATTDDGEVAALTANSFTSVSLDPPLVLVCVGVTVSSAPVVRRAVHMAIHVLGADQEHVARRLAVSGLSGAERLEGVGWAAGPKQAPYLDACTARFAGPIVDRIDAGDHIIVLVQADHVEEVAPDDPALMYFRGAFLSS